jgi:hypothetical protein
MSSSVLATSSVNGSQRRSPRCSATSASSSGSSPAIPSRTNQPFAARRAAVTRPTQPLTARASHSSTSVATSSSGKRSITPFT